MTPSEKCLLQASLVGEGSDRGADPVGGTSLCQAALCCSLHVTAAADGGSSNRCPCVAPELALGPAAEDDRQPAPGGGPSVCDRCRPRLAGRLSAGAFHRPFVLMKCLH